MNRDDPPALDVRCNACGWTADTITDPYSHPPTECPDCGRTDRLEVEPNDEPYDNSDAYDHYHDR